MSVNYNAPCRVTIFAEMANGNTRTIRIPFTGYGAERHIKRWLNRGAISVKVYVDSRSSRKNIQAADSRATRQTVFGHREAGNNYIYLFN